MTSLHLLLWIAGGILLQIALYMGVGFWRHWQAYRALRSVAKAFDLPVKLDPDPVSKASAADSAGSDRTSVLASVAILPTKFLRTLTDSRLAQA